MGGVNQEELIRALAFDGRKEKAARYKILVEIEDESVDAITIHLYYSRKDNRNGVLYAKC